MTVYNDIKALQETGCWPNKEIPGWALREAERLESSPTHSSVLLNGLMKETEKLESLVAAYHRLAFESFGEPAYLPPTTSEEAISEQISKEVNETLIQMQTEEASGLGEPDASRR